MTRYTLWAIGSLLCMNSCNKPHSVTEAAVQGAWSPVSAASLSGEPNENICFTKIKGRTIMVTAYSSGINAARFSPDGDSVTITKGCTGYSLPVAFDSSNDTLIFANGIRYVRMDSAQFFGEKLAFSEALHQASALLK
ncbi:hypothetical protein ACFPAF_15925 [Hymenobacter endophyticus]|uniref:Lipocalin-like domain-containing protein n=1 Tax=Hymenobacter endophyticus TaxID=3076335 RepID=A0ABU3TKJ0_9BACT|nr:hypothetical protein [Hymenobacter endophyticus]MDU0371889.1 hypothetical protein [Hymenobacter endophyticus]